MAAHTAARAYSLTFTATPHPRPAGCSYDHVSQQLPLPDMTLGGVFTIELLQLPPPAKRVKGWTLRPGACALCILYPPPPRPYSPLTAFLCGVLSCASLWW